MDNTTIEPLEPRKIQPAVPSALTGLPSISSIPSVRPYVKVLRKGQLRRKHYQTQFASDWLVTYPFYDGPDPPLGYAPYRAKWRKAELPEPLYAIPYPSIEGPRRRQRFWSKVYAVLVAKTAGMSLSMGLYNWLASDDTKATLHSRSLYFVAALSLGAMVFVGASYCSDWRRKPINQKLVMIVYMLLEFLFAASLASTFEYRQYELGCVTVLDAWIGVTQFTVSLFSVMLLSFQSKIELASWTGFAITMALHFTTDFVCLVGYYIYKQDRLLASTEVWGFFGIAAAWVHMDTSRMICDERCATAENEYSFAAFQIEIDIYYFAWYLWEVIGRGSQYLIGLYSRSRLRGQDGAIPKKILFPTKPPPAPVMPKLMDKQS